MKGFNLTKLCYVLVTQQMLAVHFLALWELIIMDQAPLPPNVAHKKHSGKSLVKESTQASECQRTQLPWIGTSLPGISMKTITQVFRTEPLTEALGQRQTANRCKHTTVPTAITPMWELLLILYYWAFFNRCFSMTYRWFLDHWTLEGPFRGLCSGNMKKCMAIVLTFKFPSCQFSSR